MRSQTRAFALLVAFEACYGWAWNTVDVLRPEFRAALHLSLAQAGAMYTAQGGGALVGAVGFGALADAVGRRRVLLAIVTGTALAGAAGMWVASYPALLAQRFVLGLFLGANFPVLIATYLSLFPSGLRGRLTSIGQGAYSLSIVALGYAYGHLGGHGWRSLLAASAVPALVLAPLIPWLVPDDRRLARAEDAGTRLPLLELFVPAHRRTTLLLFALVSLNFFAYQAFAGWTTLLLKEARHLPQAVAGATIAWQFAGATLGGIAWGWISDRWGRRVGAGGFFAGAGAAAAFLLVARTPEALAAAGFVWGFAINSSVAWAPWISELYPERMRSSAMSIFNWGRIVSITAPLVTAGIAARAGIAAAMLLSVAGFALGGIVWLLLPETLEPRPSVP